MKQPVLLDTGPLVAFFLRDEAHHAWSKNQFSKLRVPVMLCEPVLTEACHLLQRRGIEPGVLLKQVREGLFSLDFRLEEELDAVMHLLHRYRNLPISLADACLVRMAELYHHARVLTLDGHFRVYRKHGRQVVPLIIPESRS